jgi:NADPH2:quinone reductase
MFIAAENDKQPRAIAGGLPPVAIWPRALSPVRLAHAGGRVGGDVRAIGYRKPSLELNHLETFDIPRPTPAGRDLLVEVRAVSVNPVDYKVASGGGPMSSGVSGDGDAIKVVGYDAAGVVAETGREASLFKPGDEVFYAGSVGRQGANMEFHLVDERIVGRKPRRFDFAAAAALPLTSITAWEAMFDRLDVAKPVPGAARAILILGGAGGVGSIAIQLARQLTDLAVVATASRHETVQWTKDMGAHHVIDHTEPLEPQVSALGLGKPAFIFATAPIAGLSGDLAELIAPQGRIALINGETADLFAFRPKSVSIHHELMFTRPLFQTADIEAQHRLLNEVAKLVDSGRVRSTMRENYGRIDASNLTRAMAFLKSGRAIGKIVLEGF